MRDFVQHVELLFEAVVVRLARLVLEDAEVLPIRDALLVLGDDVLDRLLRGGIPEEADADAVAAISMYSLMTYWRSSMNCTHALAAVLVDVEQALRGRRERALHELAAL